MNRDPFPQPSAIAPENGQPLPDTGRGWASLGLARDTAGDLAGAAQAYRQALALDGKLHATGLRLGHALERQGHRREAVLVYFQAIRGAQQQGRWLNAGTTSAEARPLVEHAIAYVGTGQHEMFDAAIAPLRQRYGRTELQRVERCLRVYLGMDRAASPDARQKPTFLYFPGLPAQPYYDRAAFEWVEALESHTDAIREELQRVLPQQDGREPVFHTEDLAQANLRGAGAPRWDGYYFYRHGERRETCCSACPRAAEALDAIPLTRIPGHAPEVLFSVFAPDTHLLPHRGVTNTRLVVHLPLIVPPDCALSVGGEVHVWREGRAVIFDDTYEHEAWNRSHETRVVLIADLWHPQLSAAEREAVSALVVAIGDFRVAAGDAPGWRE